MLALIEDDASYVDWMPPAGGDPELEDLLIARSGFARSVREVAAERDDLSLVGLEDVSACFGSDSLGHSCHQHSNYMPGYLQYPKSRSRFSTSSNGSPSDAS